MDVRILRRGICDSDIKTINTLLGQLLEDAGGKRFIHNRSTITDCQEAAVIMVVRNNDTVITGLGVFSEKATLTRSVGWLDDLVVEKSYRRKGIGEAIIRAMIEAGRMRRLERLNCTCRPEKIEANILCLRVGFRLVGTINGTNFYTYEYGSQQ